MRPAAPWMATRSFGHRQLCCLDGLNDLAQIVGHGDRAIGERRPLDAAAAQHLVELLLVGRVIGDRGGGVLQLMAGEDADHALVGADDAFGAPAASRRPRWRRWPVRSPGRRRRPGPWRRGSPGRSPRAPRRRTTSSARRHLRRFTGRLISIALAMVDAGLLCRRPSRDSSLSTSCDVGLAAVPPQAAALVQFVERVGPGGVDHGQPRHAVDQAQLVQFGETPCRTRWSCPGCRRARRSSRALPSAALRARGT